MIGDKKAKVVNDQKCTMRRCKTDKCCNHIVNCNILFLTLVRKKIEIKQFSSVFFLIKT